jgi:ABC-type sugar transport system substrate-binding protein
MKKKIVSAAIVLVLTMAMASAAFAAGKSDAAGKGVVVGYIAKNSVDAFHYPINTTATRLLNDLKAKGTIQDWHFYDGLTDPLTQVQLLNDAINRGCNFIIMLPAEAAGCAPMVATCKEKNIPVIVVNSKTNNTDQLATAYVGSDDVQAGEMMAKFLQAQVPNGGGYGHIQGVIGNSAQIQRGQGLHNILDKDPKWKLLDGAEQGAEWQAEKAVRFAEDWLAKYGRDLNGIICDNDDMSSAVQAAMNAAGRRDIVAIGVDGNAGPLNMVKNGDLRATVFQDGVGQVTKAIELMVQVIGGATVPKETMVDFVLVTKDNVDKYIN